MTMPSWHWPLAGLIGAVIALGLVAVIVLAPRRRRDDEAPVFDVDEDLSTESGSSLLHRWRRLNRFALALLVLCLALSLALLARPSLIESGSESASNHDVVLCLDVSGSTLPYDRQVINTYLDIVEGFQGERIGLSIFNSTSRTVFPLTDDYDLVTSQLKSASAILKGVQSQDDIDKMSDSDYQKISDWLEGTQNRKDATSLIGDGLVGCASLLPGFLYGSSSSPSGSSTESGASSRSASILLATDNIVAGKPSYTLDKALDLTSQASITVDGLYSGPQGTLDDATATAMRKSIESHDGRFLSVTSGSSVEDLVRDIESRRSGTSASRERASLVDAPGWWVAALVAAAVAWILMTWRLKR